MSVSNVNIFEFHDENKANEWISWHKPIEHHGIPNLSDRPLIVGLYGWSLWVVSSGLRWKDL